jgi:dihydrofolate reductase
VSISLIVAVAENGVIGQENTLPWRLSGDLKRFKALTMGKPIIMGRKTFDSIGKPLPGRTNIVITRQSNLQLSGCTVVGSLSEALSSVHADEFMIIGGAEIYRQSLPLAQRVYLTQVHASIPGDAFFPVLEPSQWREIAREDVSADEHNQYAHSFITLERVTS